MVYILYGEDDYTRNEALNKIKEGLGSPEFLFSNTTVLDGKNLSIEQLKAVCDAVPFFSSQRLVIVSGLLERFETKRAKNTERGSRTNQDADLINRLESYFDDLPATTTLVFNDGNIRAMNPILKKLTPLSKVMHFPVLRGRNLHSWVNKRVYSMGLTISPIASKLLCDFTGNDLWILSNEIDKLILFVSNNTITEADIYACVSYASQANIFAMMDAIIVNRIDIAQRLVNQLLHEGIKAPQILGFIIRQLRLILLAAELLNKGTAIKNIQSTLGLSSSYAFDKILAQSKVYNFEQLKRAFCMVMNADLGIKRGQMTDDLALDILVMELCRIRN